jgi:hypothetical protein
MYLVSNMQKPDSQEAAAIELDAVTGGKVVEHWLQPGQPAPSDPKAYTDKKGDTVVYRTHGFPDMVNGFADGD